MLRVRSVIVFLIILVTSAAWAAEMTVQVRETSVRAEPKVFGKVVTKLLYGAKVAVLSTSGGWARISLAKGEGWVSLSALTGKPVDLKSGEQDVSRTASSKEVALASKGFTPEVEAEYKQEKNVDYTWVDRMCGYTVTTEQIATFAAQGGVTGLAGGAK